MSEQLPPERAVRLLRAKVAELEAIVRQNDEVTEVTVLRTIFAADIALVAQLLADHIERLQSGEEVLTVETMDGNVFHVMEPELVETGGGWRECPGGPVDVVPVSDGYMGQCPNCDYVFFTSTDDWVVPKHWVSLNGEVVMFKAEDRR